MHTTSNCQQTPPPRRCRPLPLLSPSFQRSAAASFSSIARQVYIDFILFSKISYYFLVYLVFVFVFGSSVLVQSFELYMIIDLYFSTLWGCLWDALYFYNLSGSYFLTIYSWQFLLLHMWMLCMSSVIYILLVVFIHNRSS